MNRKFVFPGVLLTIVALALPAGVSAFCTIISPTNCGAGVCTAKVSNSDSTITIVGSLVFSSQATCSPTGGFPILPYAIQTLRGTKTGAATAPVCSWNCTGTTIRFDVNDGLPVELMTFSIDE